MMLNLYVQQHQWIVIALLAGVSLMLLFCLTYSAMWRPRGEELACGNLKEQGLRGVLRCILSLVPLALILVIAASAIFTVGYLLTYASKAPNW